MSFDYEGMRAEVVIKLIREFGDEIDVRSFVDTPAAFPYDPPIRTRVDVPAHGVFTMAREQDIDDTLVRRGDQRVLIAGIIPVENSGMIVRGSELWKIIKIDPLKPGPVTMLYKAFVRK